jgi:hypothetical protein
MENPITPAPDQNLDQNNSPNLWDHKPWWCQPWSILLTGISLTSGSWFIFHRLWFTLPIGAVILVWWWCFLIVVPRLFAQEYGATLNPNSILNSPNSTIERQD